MSERKRENGGQHGSPGTDPARSDSISSSLLDRVRAAQPDAWERLVELFGPEVYHWCRQSGLQADDAADVVQEVFSAVANHVAQFRRDRPGDSFHGWLWTITRNKIRDHFRHRQGGPQAAGGTDAQQQLAQIPDQHPDTDQKVAPPSLWGGLARRAIEVVRAGVEDRTWRAFWRLAVDGQAVADVAEELGMSVRAVYEAKYRVRRRIREELGDLLD